MNKKLLASLVLACITSSAFAQEAMETAAATMPSPGILTFRPQFHLESYGQRPDVANGSGILSDNTLLATADMGIQYGLVRDWSLSFDVPLEWERDKDAAGDTDTAVGVEDIDAYLKWRFYRKDHGGIDTTRAAVLFGAEIASGDSERFSSQSVNPHIGAVITVVRGRFGFNQDIHYQWNTGGTRENNLGGDGPDDHIMAGTAFVYRVWPDAFTAESVGGWYVTAEGIQHYETNGDYELRFLPGVMYEGRTWAFEAMLELPVIEELDERPELQWGVGFGFRFTF
ncbi:MAG: hypothetical protein U0640_09625 [Phycisphaerales bacterium]